MRTKEDVQIFEGRCGCGKPLDKVNYHRPCNLVFCSDCIKTHECKPVNGPICNPEQPDLLPAAPDPLRGVGIHKKDIPTNGHRKPRKEKP